MCDNLRFVGNPYLGICFRFARDPGELVAGTAVRFRYANL